MHTC
jgi:hypothetical protein